LVALSFRCFAIWVLALPLLFSFVTEGVHGTDDDSLCFKLRIRQSRQHAASTNETTLTIVSNILSNVPFGECLHSAAGVSATLGSLCSAYFIRSGAALDRLTTTRTSVQNSIQAHSRKQGLVRTGWAVQQAMPTGVPIQRSGNTLFEDPGL
jgi:hypothetical protein